MGTPAPADATLRAELLELEAGFWRAAGDAGFYSRHLADDGVLVFSGPDLILDKAAALPAVAAAAPWESFEILAPRTLRWAPDVAALVYTARARRPGAGEMRAHVASVYARRGDAWELVLHQQSPFSG